MDTPIKYSCAPHLGIIPEYAVGMLTKPLEVVNAMGPTLNQTSTPHTHSVSFPTIKARTLRRR